MIHSQDHKNVNCHSLSTDTFKNGLNKIVNHRFTEESFTGTQKGHSQVHKKVIHRFMESKKTKL